MIINSGQSLSLFGTTFGQYADFDGIPDSKQGYGRINLEKTLYLLGNSTRNLRITPTTRTPLDNGDIQSYCVKTNRAGGTVKATLVWMDREASPLSGYLLVNDLDLFIYDTAGTIWKPASGNGFFDTLNNVEQIELNGLPMDYVLSVSVHGRRVALPKQNWILVISGDIVDTGCGGINNVCPNQCSGAGTCVTTVSTTKCQCNEGRSGADCSMALTCPTDSGKICAGNGYCNYGTGTCSCKLGYAPPACIAKIVPVTNSTTDDVTFTAPKSPYTAGLVAGSVIAAFFVGAIISIFLGGFLAVKYLEYRRDKAAKEREEEMQNNS